MSYMYIVYQIVVVLVNRELSDGSVNWPDVSRHIIPILSSIAFIFVRRSDSGGDFSIYVYIKLFPGIVKFRYFNASWISLPSQMII